MASNYLGKGLKQSVLTVALGLCFAGAVQAQSTAGNIYGTVSGGEGATVSVTNNSGFSRGAVVDSTGRYSLNTLPVGSYTVTVTRDGQVVGTREITVLAGSGQEVSFGGTGDATTLGTITVTGIGASPIDITTVDTRSVITAEQLERLPLNQTAESIALLAPGAINGAAGYFGGLVSFGGSGVSENAYYVNGFFTGEPLSNLGGFTLPYGAIAQQETYIGGYRALYGRSAGGVISQIGKRGTNEWQFGGQVSFRPEKLRAEQPDTYYPSMTLPDGYEYSNPELQGQLYSRGRDDTYSNTTFSAYVGGPIIKDRLFFFASVEADNSEEGIAPVDGAARIQEREIEDPRLYAKLDWSITDNHFLELTYLANKYERTGDYYEHDFASGITGAKLDIVPTPLIQNREYSIAKYTGYLTDNLTLSATYGHSRLHDKAINPGVLAGVPYIVSTTLQDPAITGGTPIPNRQSAYQGRDARDYTDGLRADLEWVVGDHTLTVGIDNIKFEAENEGTSQVADYWQYQRAANPDDPISAVLGVGGPGGDGYYVRELRYFTSTSMSLEQKAWYLEDRWQVTDNFLLSLGVRNDQFTNANNFGEVYMDAKDQWAPRIGASWDVFGDSSLKVFGNAGRYFLAMPNNVAIRGASASTYTFEYFTYTGIDANGLPTGLTPVPGIDGAPPPGPVSSNGETGGPVDVLSFAPSDLKNMYQDEYILGAEKLLPGNWMVGLKLTYRDLKSSIDDICDPYTMIEVMESRGIDPDSVVVPGCLMFNPGGENTFSLANVDGSGRTEVKMSSEDWGFPDGMKRTYKGLDIYLERPFDGTWEARIDYTYSKSEGNNEGQVKSEFGQSNISKTQDWDVAELMRYANGYLANDRRHQLKMRGSYRFAPEWTVGANIRVLSGMPISCLGYFNPDGTVDESSVEGDPVGYGASYHTCFGQVATPGNERTPWTKQVDVGLTYRPAAFDDRLALSVQVFNLLNEREELQVDVTSEDGPYTVSNTYMMPLGYQTPRYMMFTASYNF